MEIQNRLFTTKDPVTKADITFDLSLITHIFLPSWLAIKAEDKNKNIASICIGSFAVQCPHSMAESVRTAWWKFHNYEQPVESHLLHGLSN